LVLSFKSQYKILFTCQGEWNESPTQLLRRFSRQTPGGNGLWKNLIGTDSVKEADYFIVLEGGSSPLPDSRTIYIKREPDFIKPINPKITYTHKINFDDGCANGGVTYWLNKTYDELMSLEPPSKNKRASFVISSKHGHRNNFVERVFKEEGEVSTIDLFGRGWQQSRGSKNYYKGVLDYDGNCKLRGLLDYQYTIALENSMQKNYWTEKLADSYLSWCVPIYWGCPNITDYFPVESMHIIDIHDKEALIKIKDFISRAPSSEQIKAVGAARKKVLNNYNLWEIIYQKIKNIVSLK